MCQERVFGFSYQVLTVLIVHFYSLSLQPNKKLLNMKNEEMETQDSSIDPMYGLRFLKSIHEGLPSFEALRHEFLQDKYNK